MQERPPTQKQVKRESRCIAQSFECKTEEEWGRSGLQLHSQDGTRYMLCHTECINFGSKVNSVFHFMKPFMPTK